MQLFYVGSCIPSVLPDCVTMLGSPCPHPHHLSLRQSSRLSNRTSSIQGNWILDRRWGTLRTPNQYLKAESGFYSAASVHCAKWVASVCPPLSHSVTHPVPDARPPHAHSTTPCRTLTPKLTCWTEFCSQQRLIVRLPATFFHIFLLNFICHVHASLPKSKRWPLPRARCLGQRCGCMLFTPVRRSLGALSLRDGSMASLRVASFATGKRP